MSSNTDGRPCIAQLFGVTGLAMAAAMETEHGHPGGTAPVTPGNAVLDDKASSRPDTHLLGREQEQIRAQACRA